MKEQSTGSRTGSLFRLLICIGLALGLWMAPRPEGLDPSAWHLAAIFAGVIAGFLLQPMPMGPVVLLGLLVVSVTDVLGDGAGSLGMKAALSGYGEEVVWLVVGAFLLAGAVQNTGLGQRLALLMVKRFGRSTLGLGYAQVSAELLLGPLVPSNTARGGGILAPIAASLSRALDSHPERGATRAGRYLILVGAHANLITAAMFLTGMAANPLVSRAAQDVYGIEFGWGEWALGAIVPGLVGLALLPLVIFKLERPEVIDGRPAQAEAQKQLDRMGPWTHRELVCSAVFVTMLVLWSTKPLHGMGTTLVAWLGVGTLLLSRVQDWDEMVHNHRAWDTLIWLGGILTLANGLRDTGFVEWFAGRAEGVAGELPMLPTVLVLVLVYYYSMYGFSMLTAHISAMVGAFLTICAATEVPALLAVPLFAYFSNLCACVTNYSSGPVIIYFGLGYVPTRTWFRVGFWVSLLHLAVWIPVGLVWWKMLRWW